MISYYRLVRISPKIQQNFSFAKAIFVSTSHLSYLVCHGCFAFVFAHVSTQNFCLRIFYTVFDLLGRKLCKLYTHKNPAEANRNMSR